MCKQVTRDNIITLCLLRVRIPTVGCEIIVNNRLDGSMTTWHAHLVFGNVETHTDHPYEFELTIEKGYSLESELNYISKDVENRQSRRVLTDYLAPISACELSFSLVS